MKTSLSLLLVGGIAIFAASCNDSSTTTTEQKTDSTTTTTVAAKPAAITLSDVPASPEFPDAKLSINGVTTNVKSVDHAAPDSVKLTFNFGVKNYELKNQTADAGGKLCNNSDKGQHIHFIMDNNPYVALYEPKHEISVPVNTEHTIICFLSRSYHESIKTKEAFVVWHFKVDEKGSLQKLAAPTTPQLFYSRPKGDYLGKDTANVLLDWYLTNTTLGTDNTIKADVKNETTGATASFTLNEWKPKFIQGLGTGKCSVTLTLMDKAGQPLTGLNTTVTRNFTLAAQEPIK